MSALRLIGYWQSPQEPQWPDATRFVDSGWNQEEREIVAPFSRTGECPGFGLTIPLAASAAVRMVAQNPLMGRTCGRKGLPTTRELALRLPVQVVAHIPECEAQRPDQVDLSWWKVAVPDWRNQSDLES
jgi:hypothetical protein